MRCIYGAHGHLHPTEVARNPKPSLSYSTFRSLQPTPKADLSLPHRIKLTRKLFAPITQAAARPWGTDVEVVEVDGEFGGLYDEDGLSKPGRFKCEWTFTTTEQRALLPEDRKVRRGLHYHCTHHVNTT